jgi:hypothetical protein
MALALSPLGCQSAAERDSARLMPAVEAVCATVPAVDPKEFVRGSPGSADKLKALEAALRDGPHPPPGTPAAAKLGPAAQWAAAARAEHNALEAAFRGALAAVEQAAHADLALAVLGGATSPASEMPAALTKTRTQPILLWHGTGNERGFDEDHQNLPYPGRRAVDPSARFIVGYVQRVDGEGVTFVSERVTAGQKLAHVALYEVPSARKLGVFTVKGQTARLPTPTPPPGTTLPGEKPPLIESLFPPP